MPTTDALAAEERRKYEKMWRQPYYRKNSPGLNIAPRVHELLGMSENQTLIDYGCGEGKALDWFRSEGIAATGIDLVKLRPDVVECCLWDLGRLPEFLVTDYGFCADVMEHIPEEKIPDVLRGIRRRTRISAAFTVATVKCTCGKRAGEKLHLTVQPVGWWRRMFESVWSEVRRHRTDQPWRHLFVVKP